MENTTLRQAIKRSGFTQKDVATRIGLTAPTLIARLDGEVPWTVVEMLDICLLLGLTLKEALPMFSQIAPSTVRKLIPAEKPSATTGEIFGALAQAFAELAKGA